LQAYDTARSAVAHDATCSKAWVRLGDACKAGSRWQLAQLCFAAAATLSPRDDIIKVGLTLLLLLLQHWDCLQGG